MEPERSFTAALIRTEGAAVAILSAAVYSQLHQPGWWVFAALFLAPDLLMLGYLKNVKFGSFCYNIAHTYIAPLAAAGILLTTGHSAACWICVIWTAHIGFDRALGYGLKYPTYFRDTHLQHL